MKVFNCEHPNAKHGMRYAPEYQAWQGMKNRCLDPNHKDYPRWGARGITIFPAWIASFEAFYAHVGPRPDGMTLDRIDNTRGYFPGNVRWATPLEQAINRRDTWSVEIEGVVYNSVEHAARALSVSTMTITRWCDGYVDARRPHRGRVPSRPGCHRWRKYAQAH